MERFVIRQNVEHYRAVLKIATELAEFRRIEKLLLDEEAKLKKYDDDHKKKRPALSTSPFGPELTLCRRRSMSAWQRNRRRDLTASCRLMTHMYGPAVRLQEVLTSWW
jgi:hypothetical protein